jgi:hypothetical protein
VVALVTAVVAVPIGAHARRRRLVSYSFVGGRCSAGVVRRRCAVAAPRDGRVVRPSGSISAASAASISCKSVHRPCRPCGDG